MTFLSSNVTKIGHLFVLLGILLLCVITPHGVRSSDLPSCYPMAGAGTSFEGSNCCSLGPFNSLCTNRTDDDINLLSTPDGDLTTLLANSTQSRMSSVTPLDGVKTYVSTMTEDNPDARVVAIVDGKLITAQYTLRVYTAGDLTNIGVKGLIVYNVKCMINQLVGAIGIARVFQESKCTQVCKQDDPDTCSPYSYCALRHESKPDYVWFGVTNGDQRLFYLELLSTETPRLTMTVVLKGDCISGDEYGLTTSYVEVVDDPASGGYALQMTTTCWTRPDMQCNFGTVTIFSWDPNSEAKGRIWDPPRIAPSNQTVTQNRLVSSISQK